jgi:hypothetical protein
MLWTLGLGSTWIAPRARRVAMFLDGEMLRALFLLAGMATYMGAALGLVALTAQDA